MIGSIVVLGIFLSLSVSVKTTIEPESFYSLAYCTLQPDGMISALFHVAYVFFTNVPLGDTSVRKPLTQSCAETFVANIFTYLRFVHCSNMFV